GTIYLKDNAQANGDLIIDNGNVASTLNTPLRTALSAFRSVTVRNQGRISVAAADVPSLTIEQAMAMSGGVAVTSSGGVAWTLPRLTLDGGASLILGTGDSLTLTNSAGFDLEVRMGSTMSLGAGSVLNADTLRVNGSGSLFTTNISLSYPSGSS